MIRKEITTVGNDRGESDLDLGIVNRLRNSARGAPQCRPESSSPYNGQEKLPDSLSRAQPARNDSSEQDLKNDHGSPIVQQDSRPQ